jgi:hypothetical protein
MSTLRRAPDATDAMADRMLLRSGERADAVSVLREGTVSYSYS